MRYCSQLCSTEILLLFLSNSTEELGLIMLNVSGFNAHEIKSLLEDTCQVFALHYYKGLVYDNISGAACA